MNHKGLLVVISGFSGAGKGTLMKKLLQDYEQYALSISMTTRAPREGEVDGREYFFATREQFEDKIGKGGFIEHAQYCGNYYGTPKDYVEQQMEAGRDVILEIEIQGAMKVKEQFPEKIFKTVISRSSHLQEAPMHGKSVIEFAHSSRGSKEYKQLALEVISNREE